MLDAGYDEITHINQFMLGWVIKPEEDTRTLFRLTALMRLPALPLNAESVERTIGKMVDRKIAIDPTIGIHENLTLNRNGQIPPGAVDYFEHMPIGVQRNALQAWTDTSGRGADAAYRGAFEKILGTVSILHKRGVFIVPGTDTGGSFTYHRELELMQKIGMTPAEVLKRATSDMAQYMGLQDRGAIEKGKLADFFLVAGDPTQDLKAIKKIQMVVRGGTVYFPSEAYPEFGIKPFAAAPAVTLPPNSTAAN
jgi:Amidohydrolase family